MNIIDDWHANLTSSHYDNTSMLWAQGLRNLTTASTTLSCSASPAWLGSTVTSMTQHLHHATAKSPWQRHRQHYLTAQSPALLSIYIMSWPCCPSSAVAIMTRHLHHATTSITSVASSPAGLDSAVVSSAQQHHHQHDSVAPSPAWLSSTIASMTRHLYCTVAKLPRQRRHQHDLVALSPAWLDIYIMQRPSHHDSVITSMTRQHCHQHDSASTSHSGQVASAMLSPAWLGSIIASMTRHLHRAAVKSPR
jgi:hypothetical protein